MAPGNSRDDTSPLNRSTPGMSSSTPTPLSDTPMSPLSYQLSRSPSTEAPALNPSTRLSPPENPIHFPVPSSVFPNPSFVISRVKPWKSRLYCSRRSIQPPSKRTFPSESIESSLTWNAGQSRPPKSGVTWPLNVAVKVPPVNAKPRLSRSRRRMFGFVSVTRTSSVRNAAVNDPSRLSPISTSTSSSKYGRVMVPTISEDSRLFWTKVSPRRLRPKVTPKISPANAGVQSAAISPENPPSPMNALLNLMSLGTADPRPSGSSTVASPTNNPCQSVSSPSAAAVSGSS